MDKDHSEVHCQTDSRERGCHMEKEGYVEAPGDEIPEASIRKSSRKLSKKRESSSSQYIFRAYQNSSKDTKKSSKESLERKNSVSASKIGGDNKHQLVDKKENNGVFSEDTASMKSSTTVPNIKYHVGSKDGIQLVVDLNLSRSDWLRSMAKTVCACQNHQKPEFQSFRQEVEYLGDRNNLKDSSFDKTIGSDASLNSYVQNDVAFSSEEIQFSDFSGQQKDSSCSRTGKICSENVLPSTMEVNQETADNHIHSTAENGERVISAEGMEVSGREENGLVISASVDGPKRKKRDRKSDHIYAHSEERILRSTKLFGGQIIERDGLVIRRSSRLFSK